MNASLDEKLRRVEWGEYRMGDLFNISISKSVDKGNLEMSPVRTLTKPYSFVGRTALENGIQGYVNHLGYDPNPKNTFSVIQIGENISQFRNNEWYASQNIFLLFPLIYDFSKTHKFITASINKSLKKYSGGYNYYPTLPLLKKEYIKLPTKDGDIDFDFMESFIAELEAQRIAELEAQRIAELSAYLKVSGFDNYELSEEELNALQKFTELNDDNWGTYTVGNLFEKVATKKLPYKAKELPKQPIDDYVLPCLTSSFQNQGLNYYAPKAGATVISDVISLPSNSDVYRAYYQSRDFTVLSDSYAIQWKLADNKPTPNQYLFMVMCINKVTELPIYSYKNKLGGWNVVKNKQIRLPEKDGKIDFAFMESFISAMKKLAIKDVVDYSSTKINATKKVVSGDNHNEL